MNKRKIIFRIHTCICILFAVIWLIFIILNNYHVISINELLFQFIGIILTISLMLHRAMIKKQR